MVTLSPSEGSLLGPPGFQTREDAHKHSSRRGPLRYRTQENGYWVAFLLPMAFFISDLDLERETIAAVLVIGVNVIALTLIQCIETNLYKLLQGLKKMTVIVSGLILLLVFAAGGDFYVIASYIAIFVSFAYLFFNLIKQHPKSFTFGEGVLITSVLTYRFWGVSQSLPFPPPENPIHASEATLVSMSLQLLFFGTILVARLLLLLQKPWKLFSLEEMFCLWGKYCIMSFFTKLPTQNQVDKVALFLVTWPFKFIFANKLRIQLIFCWTLICFFAMFMYLLVRRMPITHGRSNIHHKVFHLAIVFIFLSGIVLDFLLIYYCSAIAFYFLVLSESIRVLDFEVLGIKFGEAIDGKLRRFRNYFQDQGHLLLSPLYLLAGYSLPIWLIDVDDVNDLKPVQYSACIAGIMSVGIGDTFASIGNTYFGRTRWRGTLKFVEGTICSIVAQILAAMILYIFEIIPCDAVLVSAQIAAIVMNAIIGGNTNQNDYLVLPLVTFIVVHGFNLIFSSVTEV